MTEPSPYAGTSAVTSLGQREGLVTLVEGQTFCLSGRTGDLRDDLPHGLFVLDTRVLSAWELSLNGHPVEPLTVDTPDPFTACFVSRGRPAPGHADADLVAFRRRRVGTGMREEIEVVNHGLTPLTVAIELTCRADFADLFAVKESRVVPRGEVETRTIDAGVELLHRHGGHVRSVTVSADRPAEWDDGRLRWRTTLAPKASWAVCLEVDVAVDGTGLAARFRCGGHDDDTLPERRLAQWRAHLPVVRTDHHGLAMAVDRAGDDLGALRIFDPDHPELPILAAGAPWFMTVFGRDSLLTAWMTLMADPTLARGVLETLARFQGRDVVAETEEEPGKILHEIRFGGATGLSLRGGHAYYGSVDATPLFVMVLAELRRWDPDDALVDRLLPAADAALEWVEHFGDADGDGFVEYERRSAHGLVNQGWKDSWDAVRHLDGTLARAPIALCEVQGYVYAAYVARGYLALEAGDTRGFQRFRAKALALRERFNEAFWLEEHGWFAMALDADKRPVGGLASNMGHCLWTGIVDPERAAQVAAHLVGDDLFSGWGIRTLAASMPAYNPVSYHNGSVWPHDNALCAAGLARYGFVDEAHRVIKAQVDAAAAHQGRLPELFAGFERGRPASPAAYPTSCSPQAWAAASPLLWIRTLLRFDPWAPHGQVWLHPRLPEWIHHLEVDGIAVAGNRLRVAVHDGAVEVTGAGALQVVQAPRPPLTSWTPGSAEL